MEYLTFLALGVNPVGSDDDDDSSESDSDDDDVIVTTTKNWNEEFQVTLLCITKYIF